MRTTCLEQVELALIERCCAVAFESTADSEDICGLFESLVFVASGDYLVVNYLPAMQPLRKLPLRRASLHIVSIVIDQGLMGTES